MRLPTLLVLICALGTFAPPTRASAQTGATTPTVSVSTGEATSSHHLLSDASAHPNRVVSITQGVRITVSTTGRTYPRDALIRVWIGLRNVSRHTIYLPGSCQGPPNPYVTVLNHSGRVVFPPLVPAPMPHGHPVMGCTPPIPMPVTSGHIIHWSQQVVVRGSWVVAHVGLGGAKDYLGPSLWINSQLRVQLAVPDAPHVTVNRSPQTSIDVSAAPGVGPLIVSEWWLCPGDLRENGAQERMLDPRVGTRLTLPCAHPIEWHGLVGRLNHSVARFDLPMLG